MIPNLVCNFVCRDEELALATRALRERTRDGIVVAGGAGVGKTRFLDEICEVAVSQGYQVVRAAASAASGGMSYATLTRLMETASTMDRATEAHRAGEQGPPKAERRFALAVDDAHLLDDRAAALVHHLVVGLRIFTILSIVTDVESTPLPILTLWKDSLVERIELPPLSRENVAFLLKRCLRADIDCLTAQMLWDASGGNLSVHQELVTSGLDTGDLRMTDEVWSWHGPLRPTPRLSEFCRARLGQFGEDQCEALELLAIANPIGVEQIANIIPKPVLEELEARRVLVTERRNGRIMIRFRLPVDAAVIAARIPELRARRYRLDLSDGIEQSDTLCPDDLVRMICWRLDSGIAQSVDILLSGTAAALAGRDLPRVHRCAEAAVQAGATHQVTAALVWALLADEPSVGAEAALIELAKELQGDESAAIYQACALNALVRRHDLSGSSSYLQQADTAATSPGARREARSVRALTASFGGQNRECLQMTSTPAIDILESMSARTNEALARGLCLTAMDRMQEVGAALDLSRPTAGAPSGSIVEWMVEVAHGMLLTRDGRLAEAMTHAHDTYRLAVGTNSDFAVALACVLQSHVAGTSGNAVAALQFAQEGLAHGRRSGSPVAVSLLLSEVAYSALLLGDSVSAASALAQLDRDGCQHRSMSVLTWRMELARAWLILGQGDVEAAVEHLMDLAIEARSAESWGLEAEALYDVYRMGSSTPTHRLQELATIGGAATRLFAAHLTAASDGDALDAIAVSFEGRGYVLFAAEARAQASVAHDSNDSLALRVASAAQAQLLADQCPGVSTPCLARIVKPDLTVREREIARLAIEGRSNIEIAELLVVSVRTVENHLHRVYGKIGVGKRDELRGSLGPFV